MKYPVDKQLTESQLQAFKELLEGDPMAFKEPEIVKIFWMIFEIMLCLAILIYFAKLFCKYIMS